MANKLVQLKNGNDNIYPNLGIKEYDIFNYLQNSWSTNGKNFMANVGGLKIMMLSLRNGTSTTITTSLPNDMKPSTTLLINAGNLSSTGYVLVTTSGEISISSNIFSSGNGAVIFTAIYT